LILKQSHFSAYRYVELTLRKLLRENPGLKSRLPELFLEAYPQGIDWAVIETNVSRSVFQSTCPWSLEQAIDDGFWPD
jgi:hypothetical protein